MSNQNEAVSQLLGTDTLSQIEQQVKSEIIGSIERGIRGAFHEIGGEPHRLKARKVKRTPQKRDTPLDLPKLTDLQAEVLRAIQDHFDEHGESPTYGELKKATGNAGASAIVHTLKDKGYIELNDQKRSRKIEVRQCI